MYIIENRCTLRAAKEFNVSKSCIHADIHKRLKDIDEELYNDVINLLDYNKAIRHIRGGQSTQKKFRA